MKKEREDRKCPALVRNLQRVKTYAAGASCLLAACLAAACGDDDDDGGGAAGGMPPVANAGIQFPVTTVYHNSRVINAFSYEDGRMTIAYDSYGDTLEFYSNPLTAKRVIHDSYYTETEEYKNIRVNSLGFITSCSYDYSEVHNDEKFTAHSDITIDYDGEGHRVLEKYELTNSDGESGNGTATYTWENGNLIKVSSMEFANYEGEDDTWRYEEEYTYNEGLYPNPGVWHFFNHTAIGIGTESLPDEFLYAGLLGEPTKNIPTSYKESQYFDDEFYDYTTEGVDYNDDGSVRSIRSRYVYTHSGYERTSSDNKVSFDYEADWDGGYGRLLPSYNRQKKNIVSGSHRGRRGLHKRLAERIAQRKNAR